jgi:hypothetical protein
MAIKRKSVRFPAHARARIPRVLEEDALLKNLSITGCCIECTTMVNIQLDTVYKMEIIPEAASNVGSFELSVESRWIHMGGYSCEMGFMISSFPKGKLFQRYVDYLSWRSQYE